MDISNELKMAQTAEANNFHGKCCEPFCSGMKCPAGHVLNPTKAAYLVSKVNAGGCCLPTCETFKCSAGWVKNPATANFVAASLRDIDCCLATCAKHACGAGWFNSTDPIQLSKVRSSDSACCKPSCNKFQCPEGSALKPSAANISMLSASSCCESSLCGALRSKNKVQYCNSVSDEVACNASYDVQSNRSSIAPCAWSSTYKICRMNETSVLQKTQTHASWQSSDRRFLIGACACPRAQYLYSLLEVGGILVGPFQSGHSQQLRRVIRESETHFKIEILNSVHFASLIEPSSSVDVGDSDEASSTPVPPPGTPVVGLPGVPFAFALRQKPWTLARNWAYPHSFRCITAIFLRSRNSVGPLPLELWIEHILPWCPRWWFDPPCEISSQKSTLSMLGKRMSKVFFSTSTCSTASGISDEAEGAASGDEVHFTVTTGTAPGVGAGSLPRNRSMYRMATRAVRKCLRCMGRCWGPTGTVTNSGPTSELQTSNSPLSIPTDPHRPCHAVFGTCEWSTCAVIFMGVFRLAWCLIGASMADDKELQRLFRWVMTWPQAPGFRHTKDNEAPK
eukprot:symbB.v1.2.017104.t1/scaffold1326.1/size125234/5